MQAVPPSAETQTPPDWLCEVLGESVVVDTACQASFGDDGDEDWLWQQLSWEAADAAGELPAPPLMLDATVDTDGLGPSLPTRSEGCQAGSPALP